MKDNKDLDNEMLDENGDVQPQNLNTAEKILKYIEKNSKIIIIASLAVIVLIVGFIFLRKNLNESSEKEKQLAGAALSRVMEYYNANDYEKALFGDPNKMVRDQKVIGLVEIAKKYKGTPQSYLAAFYAGQCFLAQQKPNEAKEQFKYALESNSKLVLQGANAGMGAVHEYENNLKEAAESYKKAVSYAIDFESKSRYGFYMGYCYEKLNDKENAIKIYKELINQARAEAMSQGRPASTDNNYDFVKQAKAGLARLGTIID